MTLTIKAGDKFNMLSVIEEVSRKGKNRYFKCLCECGVIKDIRLGHLRSGDIKSCGCLQAYITKKRSETHKMSTTRFYRIYKGMYNRCYYEKHPEFKYRGGKGVECEWKCFEEFMKDMYEAYLEHEKKYGTKNTTIDRINGNGNYCKENCRWATYKIQANNKVGFETKKH